MRSLFVLLAIVVIAAIGLVATGLVDIHQKRPASAPSLQQANGSIRAVGGQTPEFDIETGSVGIKPGTAKLTVPVPAVEIRKPEANAANTAAPATAN